MGVHEELAEMAATAGVGVFGQADAFRAALDDFLPEDALTVGEQNLLVDAIRLGAFARLEDQLGHGANLGAAIEACGDRLARDRGTMEVGGARWALAALAYGVGKAPVGEVSVRHAEMTGIAMDIEDEAGSDDLSLVVESATPPAEMLVDETPAAPTAAPPADEKPAAAPAAAPTEAPPADEKRVAAPTVRAERDRANAHRKSVDGAVTQPTSQEAQDPQDDGGGSGIQHGGRSGFRRVVFPALLTLVVVLVIATAVITTRPEADSPTASDRNSAGSESSSAPDRIQAVVATRKVSPGTSLVEALAQDAIDVVALDAGDVGSDTFASLDVKRPDDEVIRAVGPGEPIRSSNLGKNVVRCWDDVIADATDCSTPSGVDGLRWVFPVAGEAISAKNPYEDEISFENPGSNAADVAQHNECFVIDENTYQQSEESWGCYRADVFGFETNEECACQIVFSILSRPVGTPNCSGLAPSVFASGSWGGGGQNGLWWTCNIQDYPGYQRSFITLRGTRLAVEFTQEVQAARWSFATMRDNFPVRSGNLEVKKDL